MKKLRESFFEVAGPVLPVAILIVILQLLAVRAPGHIFARFGIGVALVVVGLFFFLLGVRMGLLPVGEYIGSHLPERVKPWLLAVVVFLMGTVATIADPDVRVLAALITDVTEGSMGGTTLILVIGAGLGLALALAVIRQILGIRPALIFGVGYLLILALFPFVSPTTIAVSLDSGSTTTGPLVVPLIMAIGLGVARTLMGRGRIEDGFGLVGIASMGPAVLLILVSLFI